MNDLNSELDLEEFDSKNIVLPDEFPAPWDSGTSDHRADEFEPPSDDGLLDEPVSEHWLNRLRVILSQQHQSLLAWVLLACLIFMTVFFSFRWYLNQRLIDIDRAAPIRAEFKVDINSAELGEIVLLPGVGRKLAQAIVDHRQRWGDFESLNELCDVPGIGEKTLNGLQPYLLPITPNALNK